MLYISLVPRLFVIARAAFNPESWERLAIQMHKQIFV